MSAPGGHGNSSQGETDDGEPRTPLWLPLLGLCLFVLTGIWFLVSGGPATGAGAAPDSSAAAAPSGSAP